MDLLNRYKKFGIEAGQPWIGPKDKLYEIEGLSDVGSLLVKSGAKTIDLHSVNHDLKWAYQSKNRVNYPILCADLGNTALKLAVFSREGEKLFYKRFSYDQIDLIPFLELRNKFNLPDGWPIHYIGVNPDKAQRFSC